MKPLARLCFAAAAIAVATASASAATLSLVSFGTNGTNPSGAAGAANSALLYTGTPTTTYNIGTGGGTWAGPLAGSSWVSRNPGDCPGCGNVEPSGTYTYTSTFNLTSAAGVTGSIMVLADDTTSVFLNGTLITPAAAPTTAGKCTIGQPNCVTTATYNLTGFLAGTNTLTFGVQQIFGSATGIDFSGTVNTSTVPEPGSLLLLGTGLLGSAGAFYRRIRA